MRSLVALTLVACTSRTTPAPPPEDDAILLDVLPRTVSLFAGADARVAVGLDRSGVYRTGTVVVAIAGLPAGVTADSTAVGAGATSAVVTLHAAADAPLSDAVTIAVAASRPCAGACPVLAEAGLQLSIGAPFDFALDSPAVSLAQGATAAAAFRIAWTAAAAPVSIHVAGLPDGVAVPDVALAAASRSGAISFSAARLAVSGGRLLTVTAKAAGYTVVRSLALEVVPATPVVRGFSASPSSVFVGESTTLSAVFDGESAFIDGIGDVQSGVPIETGPLSRTTTFTLRVTSGGSEAAADTTVAVAYRDRIRVLADAGLAQTNHVAAALPGGGALVMGGNTSDTLNVPDSTSSQLFDVATGAFTRGPDLLFTAQAGVFTSVVELADGSFLLAGAGPNDPSGQVRSVVTERFDSVTGFTRVGNVVTRPVIFRTATALHDGGALLSGGGGPNVIPTDAVDRYDPTHKVWHVAGSMTQIREAHTATVLADGRVLIAGGVTCCDPVDPPTEFFSDTAEIYDPVAGSFTPTGSLAAARGLHAAALLPDGRVLITGGSGNGAAPLGTEIYDPCTGKFTAAGDLTVARDTHAAVALADGRVLVIGGQVPPVIARRSGVAVTTTEIYDPVSGQWAAGPNLLPAFVSATITLLRGGQVLIFGGADEGGFPQAAAALFE